MLMVNYGERVGKDKEDHDLVAVAVKYGDNSDNDDDGEDDDNNDDENEEDNDNDDEKDYVNSDNDCASTASKLN